MPFVALVDSLVEQAQAHKIRYEKWADRSSRHKMSQLLVVSTNQAVSSLFRYYAQRLVLYRQLAHVFFDKCYIVLTDIFYYTHLCQLWTLCYLKGCLFTCLTAILIVDLEYTFRERLLLKHALTLYHSTVQCQI